MPHSFSWQLHLSQLTTKNCELKQLFYGLVAEMRPFVTQSTGCLELLLRKISLSSHTACARLWVALKTFSIVEQQMLNKVFYLFVILSNYTLCSRY